MSVPGAPDERASALVAIYERSGYARANPAILQDAEPFLDLSGEDIRRRMFLTSDPAGRELCLRPDMTIPVARDYLDANDAGQARGFCYLGPVFRYRADGPNEFLQAGIESFGRTDIAAADAEMLSLGLETTAYFGLEDPVVRMGDVGLFAAFVGSLQLGPAWKRRLYKHFNRKDDLQRDLAELDVWAKNPDRKGVLAALAGSEPQAAKALVTDLLSIAGIQAVGGRSVEEIAERFLDQAALHSDSGLPNEIQTLIARFLAISGDPDQAAGALRALASDANLQLDAALDLFDGRTGFLAARGVDVTRIAFSTAFGRGLDYYTGMVFELHDPEGRSSGPLVAGGRYDGLLTRLGAPAPNPAVGFSVWINRLATVGTRA